MATKGCKAKGGEKKEKKTNDQPPHLRTPRIQASLTGTQGTQRPTPAASLAQQWIAQAGAGCWSVCGRWGGQAGRGKTRSPHPPKKSWRGEKKPQRTARSFSPSSFHTLPSSLPSSVKLSSVWTQGGHRGVGGKEGGGPGRLERAWLIGTQVCVWACDSNARAPPIPHPDERPPHVWEKEACVCPCSTQMGSNGACAAARGQRLTGLLGFQLGTLLGQGTKSESAGGPQKS